ncbi:hypothetical protein [Acinetobacter sp. Marseille-Q1618]|uniref:hypothetical protein n=1 Tax=Acinetobacter sp. Marseille-Q1618 TaxID=2697502 RepID=UPI001570A371|nr:hypothetical protein [Acinetobacter sp. Marseille-Q1618]
MSIILISLGLAYLAIVILLWQLITLKKQAIQTEKLLADQEKRLIHHEDHLAKTLKLMHDLANNVHGQNELLEQTTVRVKKLEVQNGELVSLISKIVKP